MYENVNDHGAVGGGDQAAAALNSAAFSKAIAAACEPGGTRRVYIPDEYFLAEALLNYDSVVLEGKAGFHFSGGYYPSQLHFPDKCCGVVFHHSNTTSDKFGYNLALKAKVPRTEAKAKGAFVTSAGSLLKNLMIRSGAVPHVGVADGVTHGVIVKSGVAIENVWVAHFAGNGIHIKATSGADLPENEGNANSFKLDSTLCSSNGGDGVLVDGNDVNAGGGEFVSVINNEGWGINDSSFLGNTWGACHAAGNTLGQYQADNINARTVYLGCYSEVGGKPSRIVKPNMVIGGLHGAGVTGGGLVMTGKNIDNGVVFRGDDGNSALQLSVRPYGNDNILMQAVMGTNITRLFDWDPVLAAYIMGRNGGSASAWAASITNNLTVGQFGTGAKVPAGRLHLQGFYLGNNHVNGRWVTNGTGVPTTGAHARGERVLHRDPVAGGFEGWVCVTSGTPGIWKTFGTIAA